MANVLSADFSWFLANLSRRLSPVDRHELISAIDDIDGGTVEDPIHSVNDQRVGDKPRKAINRLVQMYPMFSDSAAA